MLSYRTLIRAQPTTALVIFHGYGDNAEGISALAQDLAAQLPPTVAFFCPDGFDAAQGIPSGRAWFTLDDYNPQDISTNAETALRYYRGLLRFRPNILDRVTPFLTHIMREYALTWSNIIVLGFSQGAFVAQCLAQAHPDIAGIVSLSGVLMLDDQLTALPKMLLVHGTHDRVLPYAGFKIGTEFLRAHHIPFTALTVPGMDHTITPQAFSYAVNFITTLLQPASPTDNQAEK